MLGRYQIIAASATINNPSEHLEKLAGAKFSVIGDEAENDPIFNSFQDGINILKTIKMDLDNPVENMSLSNESSLQTDDNHRKIILPNSVGLDTKSGRNEEFVIKDIFYSPTYGLSYKGRHLSETSKRMTTETWKAGVPIMIIPVTALQEIPGESQMGLYDLETGEITDNSIA